MRASATVIILSCLFGVASAAPTTRAFTGCDVSNDVVSVPSGQITLVAPTALKTIHIALGVGTQNYSCSAAGTYASIGAVAKLYDASCVYNLIESISNKESSAEIAVEVVTGALGSGPLVLGHHYFVNNPSGAAGISPTFDFRADSEKGNPNAYVITSKIGDIPSPTNPTTNVDWLELQAIPGQGELATNVFRMSTLGGQPATSCTPGSAPTTIPYAALYWFLQ